MISAHGLGGGSDLPIPANYAIFGGTAALVLSFAVLLLAWRSPRYTEDQSAGRRVPGLGRVVDAMWVRVALRLSGLAYFGFGAWAAVAGPDELINPVLGMAYVLLWVGLVPLSLLFGPFYRAISPVRTIHLGLARLSRSDPETGLLTYPGWLGYWPAALGLFAFAWLELVSPDQTEVSSVRLWFALYLAFALIGGALFGDRWIERSDPFEVYSTLVGHLSPWGRDNEDHLVVRSPLRGISRLTAAPGLVGVASVLLGSTAFDSFRGSGTWIRFVQASSLDVTLLETSLLSFVCLVVAVTFSVATMMTGVDHDKGSRSSLPGLFAASIVPIVVGYVIAHYLSYLVEYGQITLIQMSDPLGTGADLFGTAGWDVNYWLSLHPATLASIKVLAIVVGHVLGVIVAHDKAIQALPRRSHVVGQIPLLLAMVLYTFGGLYLLFGA